MKAYGKRHSIPCAPPQGFKNSKHPRSCSVCRPKPQGGGNKARARRDGKAECKREAINA